MIRKNCIHTEGRYHDCGTVDAVNRLIPRAEELARAECAADYRQLSGGWYARFFLGAMDRLAKNAGLRS